MKTTRRSLGTIGTGLLAMLSIFLTSCDWSTAIVLNGRILDYERLNRSTLKLTTELEYHCEFEPDSLLISDDGEFSVYLHSRSPIIPEALSLRQNDTIVAKLFIKQMLPDSIRFIDPLTLSVQRFAFDARDYKGPIELGRLVVRPSFDSASIRLLDDDQLIDYLEYTGHEYIFHFKRTPPQGCILELWRGSSEDDDSKDTTIHVAEPTVHVNDGIFWNKKLKKNNFIGGRLLNPVGWSEMFDKKDFVRRQPN